MRKERTIKPCPICAVPMRVQKSSAMAEGGQRKWFYFVYCEQCGYGPSHAFDTIFRAIAHWNRQASPTVAPHLMNNQKESRITCKGILGQRT